MRVLALLLLLTVGCDKTGDESHRNEAQPAPSEEPAPAPEVQKTGIEACDALLAAIDTCAASAPAERKNDLLHTRALYVRQAHAATSDSAKQAVAIGCQAELDALPTDDCAPR